MDFRKEISVSIAKAIPSLRLEEIENLLENPPDKKLGDFALPCFKLSSLLKKSPIQICTELQQKISLPEGIEKVQASGPFLNFFLKKESLAKSAIPEVLKLGKNFGNSKLGKGKKVMVEFVSPNTNKPLHVGHSRNSSLGIALCNLFTTQGFKPVKAILVNDRGVHICKSMIAFEKYGNKETPKKAGKKPDHFVGDYYVLFNQKALQNPALEEEAQEMLRSWEKGNKRVLALWKLMNSWALKGQEETLKKLGIKFDKYYFESKIYKQGKSIVMQGLKKKIFEKNNENVVIARLEDFGMPDKVMLRSDGTSVYMTQDLYLAKKKFEDFKNLQESLYVVGNEQDLHFKQLFKILELLNFPFANKCRHVHHGLISLPEGRIKSREGKTADADDLIAELEALAQVELVKRYPEISEKDLKEKREAIALSALKFFLLKIEAQKDFVFNPSESISFEGETGPYLLYSFARCKSILRKAEKKEFSGKIDFSFLITEREKEISAIISQYPEVLKSSLKNYSPHVLCHYLLKLSSTFNSYYHETQVLKAENLQTTKARLALVKAVGIVLENGLNVLGIKVLERM